MPCLMRWHATLTPLLQSCDLGRLTIYPFVESSPAELLLSAPQSYVGLAQKQCIEYAANMLEICNSILENRPDFVPRDAYIVACLYQAVRITLWDLFRHPSPSNPIKKFT